MIDKIIAAGLALAFLSGCDNAALEQAPVDQSSPEWLVHIIDPDPDNKGPDGVRLADVNKDGRMDIVTGWEEGNQSKIYLNPGPAAIKEPWPAANIMTFDLGDGFAPEDAVAADLDQDGHFDLISSSDGGISNPHHGKGIRVHFSNGMYNQDAPSEWVEMQLITDSTYMFTQIWDVNQDGHADIVSGGKKGMLSWWQAPENDKRTAANWIKHDIGDVVWVMSNIPYDIDGDGDLDIVITDRQDHGGQGAYWFEHPGHVAAMDGTPWTRHELAPTQQALFMVIADVDGDGIEDFVMSDKDSVTYARRTNKIGKPIVNVINIPAKIEGLDNGRVKGVDVANLDNDDDMEIFVSWERGIIGYLDHDGSPNVAGSWRLVDTGIRAEKFDNIYAIDMDGDGDLDGLTTEENSGLGVVWFENPL